MGGRWGGGGHCGLAVSFCSLDVQTPPTPPQSGLHPTENKRPELDPDIVRLLTSCLKGGGVPTTRPPIFTVVCSSSVKSLLPMGGGGLGSE